MRGKEPTRNLRGERKGYNENYPGGIWNLENKKKEITHRQPDRQGARKNKKKTRGEIYSAAMWNNQNGVRIMA